MQTHRLMIEFGKNRGKPIIAKSIISYLVSVFTRPSAQMGELVETGWKSLISSNLEHHVLNIFQWWSVGTFSLIFSSLLRISKKDGLWFMSAAQHLSVKLRKIQEERNQQPHFSKSSSPVVCIKIRQIWLK